MNEDRELRFLQIFDLLMQELTPDERIEILNFIFDHYCLDCGGEHEPEVEPDADSN